MIFGNWKPFNNDVTVFYFTLKAHFLLKILTFLSWFFAQVEKWLDYKEKINFKIHDVKNWETIDNHNTNIAQYLQK